MLSRFIEKQLKKARYKLLKDGPYFGEVPGLRGVWAEANTLEECREELREVLEDWVFLKVRDRERITGFEIKFDRRSLVKHA
jgi:predicted RNase H-like HicB family nuclease